VSEQQELVMTLKQLSEGIAIICKYTDHGSHDVATEHDEIWIGPAAASEMALTVEDMEALEALGWAIDVDVDRWHHFT